MFYYSSEEQKWEKLAKIRDERMQFAAGVISYPDGSIKLLIAGGFIQGSYQNSTEFYDIQEGKWNPGMHLHLLYGR